MASLIESRMLNNVLTRLIATLTAVLSKNSEQGLGWGKRGGKLGVRPDQTPYYVMSGIAIPYAATRYGHDSYAVSTWGPTIPISD
eukprot:488246-Rhodomonas_salina.1